MRLVKKHTEKIILDQTGKNPPNTMAPRMTTTVPKLMVYLILFISATYIVYALKLLKSSDDPCIDQDLTVKNSGEKTGNTRVGSVIVTPDKTELKHIVFGIAASAKLWEIRKNYIKLWWKKDAKMRGIVWLDKPVKTQLDEGLPPVKISGDTSRFSYTHKKGHRSAIRISRIVSETVRLRMDNVRWFVLGDDDTVFIIENLVRVLKKYDHKRFYYIGSSSESHLQNIHFSYGMAYGGGGIAISYPLAVALEKMQDRCIQRYPGLYGSDDRLQACIAELGVPLTKELGFHQYDVYGNLFGLLSAHPVTPLVSLHHLDVIEPIFPETTRVKALERFMLPMRLDAAGLIQQSICYDKPRSWTVSVSWGFSIQVFRGILSPREVEKPSRTFVSWYRNSNDTAYAFNTRPFGRNPCQKPFVFYMTKVRLSSTKNQTVSEYTPHRVPRSACKWKIPDPSSIDNVVVYKKPDPQLWDRPPRRNCCRVSKSRGRSLVVDVGVCKEGEIITIKTTKRM